MTLLVMESFEHVDSLATLQQKYGVSLDGFISINFTNPGRFGTGKSFGTTCATATGGYSSYLTMTFDPSVTIFFGFGYHTSTGNDSNSEVIFKDGATIQCKLRLGPDGNIQLVRSGNTLIVDSGYALPGRNTWYWIEGKITINNSTGVLVVKVNGTEVLNSAGIDTQESASAEVDNVQFRMFPDASDACLLDDVYICNDQGSLNNDFLGDHAVQALFPDADGTYSQFVPTGAASNYEAVDDASPDGDTSYNIATIATSKDSFLLADPVGTDLTVAGLQVTASAKKLSAGDKTLRFFVDIEGTLYYSDNFTLGGTYTMYKYIFENNPATANPWTVADLQSVEVGYEIVS